MKFAWLCAVRALPFLSAKRNFDYWKEETKQEHLFAVFNAVDIASAADGAGAHAAHSAYTYAAYAAYATAAAGYATGDVAKFKDLSLSCIDKI